MNDKEILEYLNMLFQRHFLLKTVPKLIDFAKVCVQNDITFVHIDHEGTNLHVRLRFNPDKRSFSGFHWVVDHFKMVKIPNPNAL